jgi:hypothetical protein
MSKTRSALPPDDLDSIRETIEFMRRIPLDDFRLRSHLEQDEHAVPMFHQSRRSSLTVLENAG